MLGGYDLPLRSAMGTTMLCHKNSHLKGAPSKQSPRILWKGMSRRKKQTNKQKQKTDGKKKEIKVIDVFLNKHSKIAS